MIQALTVWGASPGTLGSAPMFWRVQAPITRSEIRRGNSSGHCPTAWGVISRAAANSFLLPPKR